VRARVTARARVERDGSSSQRDFERNNDFGGNPRTGAGRHRGDTAARASSAMVHASGTSDVDVRERTNERATARAREERERERDAATTTGAGD